MNDETNISLKLIVSKSKKVVCYAETGEDFVNLLFSFLVLPLGFLLKQMRFGTLKGYALITCTKVSRILISSS